MNDAARPVSFFRAPRLALCAPLLSARAPRFALCALLLSTLAGAAVEDWVRKGNEAFERGDFEAAVAFYERAEGRILDPGLVAFNKGAALYELGDYTQAAEQYAAALEDAAGVRRVKSLYGLANAQTRQGGVAFGKEALAQLRLAIRNYQDCLKEEPQLAAGEAEACRETWDNARANLRLAEAILARKQTERPPDPSSGNEGREPDRDDSGDQRSPGERSHGKPPRILRAQGKPVDPGEATPAGSDQHSPGAGNLPTRLDGAVTLDAGQALEYLQQAMDRLRRDRARALSTIVEQSAGVRDW